MGNFLNGRLGVGSGGERMIMMMLGEVRRRMKEAKRTGDVIEKIY